MIYKIKVKIRRLLNFHPNILMWESVWGKTNWLQFIDMLCIWNWTKEISFSYNSNSEKSIQHSTEKSQQQILEILEWKSDKNWMRSVFLWFQIL